LTATFSLRRFSKLEMPRRIERKHLIAFLESHADYSSARGAELPPVRQEDGLDYGALGCILPAPDSSTRDDRSKKIRNRQHVFSEIALTQSIGWCIYVSLISEMNMGKLLSMLNKLMKILKALSDANRIRALAAARHGDLCACQIIELLGLAPSTVSKHMNILKDAGFVSSKKQGKWTYYCLSKDRRNPTLQALIALVFKILEKDSTVKTDRGKLKKILEVTPLELCQSKKCLSRKTSQKCIEIIPS
jgi:DNA-binding transcriptional ArsR family regulator